MRGALLLVLLVGACSSGGPQQPLDQLDETAFWALVAQAGEIGGPRVEDRAAAMTAQLRGATAPRLESYQRLLVRFATAAETVDTTELCGTDEPVGAWLVAQGKQSYDGVLADPESLGSLAGVETLCTGVGEAFGNAAVARYSDLGYVPGSDAFPLLP